MKNIALLVYDASLTGGAEHVAINLANAFSKTHRVCLISTFLLGTFPKEIDEKVSCFALSDKYEKIPFHLRKYGNRLKKILIDNQIDILLPITAGVVTLAVQGAKGTNTKVFYCEHSNLENRTYGWKHVFRQFCGATKADAVITLTERDRSNFIKLFRIPKEKVTVIPNWYSEFQADRAYDSRSKKIISVGRLEPVKGYEYILDCARIILADNPDWTWDIYGEGSLHERLQNAITADSIDRLTLKGNVSNIKDKYKEYAFMVMTSRYEGLPLSLLEAQAASLPIVSFDCPTGPSEIIVDGVNGFIVPQFDTNLLVERVRELISSEKMRRDFSAHAQDRLPFYSKERVLGLWESLFLQS